MTLSKAAVHRWFADRDGQTVDTVQVRPSGITWEPGPRTVEVTGPHIRLDGSTVQLTPNHFPLQVSDDAVRIEWRDADGTTIHITTYRSEQ